MIRKVLVANRGEIALRIIRACKEMGLQTVSIHSTADEKSLHRFLADQDVCIGEPQPENSYLNIHNIISAAEITGADAIHPGYGFLSESARFSDICEQNGINFIGPSRDIIDKMGDKANARATMKKAGIPIIPGTGILRDKAQASKEAEKIGYPIMLKATAGGGGRGMRICQNARELNQFFDITRHEARAAFGNGDIYMEKCIVNPHHVEVQIMADAHGNVIHLGERDCSIQRKHQKLIEETPSPFITEKLRKTLRETAVKGIRKAGYKNAGTLEFLVDEKMNFYFIEMNTRIQVEHTISELYTGIDLVKAQILAANGERLAYNQNKVIFRGHVIECRINAEDTENGFAPCPGKITGYHLPQGLGVRVDSHCYADYEIPPYYDSLIAKLIVWGIDRREAIARMKRSLAEFVVDGVKNTIPFHRKVMENKIFLDGKYGTHFLEQFKS